MAAEEDQATMESNLETDKVELKTRNNNDSTGSKFLRATYKLKAEALRQYRMSLGDKEIPENHEATLTIVGCSGDDDDNDNHDNSNTVDDVKEDRLIVDLMKMGQRRKQQRPDGTWDLDFNDEVSEEQQVPDQVLFEGDIHKTDFKTNQKVRGEEAENIGELAGDNKDAINLRRLSESIHEEDLKELKEMILNENNDDLELLLHQTLTDDTIGEDNKDILAGKVLDNTKGSSAFNANANESILATGPRMHEQPDLNVDANPQVLNMDANPEVLNVDANPEVFNMNANPEVFNVDTDPEVFNMATSHSKQIDVGQPTEKGAVTEQENSFTELRTNIQESKDRDYDEQDLNAEASGCNVNEKQSIIFVVDELDRSTENRKASSDIEKLMRNADASESKTEESTELTNKPKSNEVNNAGSDSGSEYDKREELSQPVFSGIIKTGGSNTQAKSNVDSMEDCGELSSEDSCDETDKGVTRHQVGDEMKLPHDFLTLYHSFGYECTKRSNLHLLSSDHIMFSTGNTFQILNMKTKKQVNLRSTRGDGIGALAVHSSRKYFAVSEKGFRPDIVIYTYPGLKKFKKLPDGTEEAYANLDFSPNGEKLASIGSSPDYMLTIWDWRNEQVILRSKAFSQDIYKIAFSTEDEGHLCSSGTGHIRFWTMAYTFTGLKLQGELGRFGTTELSDISGFVELPDGKVLSGSEWGNLLLWDGGLIKVEITRKGKKTCHQGNVEQFFLDEGELITIGLDGFVKVWDFESIDTADSTDESKLFELEPMSELKVANDAKLLSMVKSINKEESTVWYAQDANGAIWKLDLSFSHTSNAPVKLFSYHAGKITALAVSPISHIAATTGEDGTVRLFDYLAKTPLCENKFNSTGNSLIWMPKIVDLSCSSILVGFADGVVRHLSIVENNQQINGKKTTKFHLSFHLSQVMKPHTKEVTCMAIDGAGKFLATGSKDGTVFFFALGSLMKPIGFVDIGADVVSLDWSTITMGNKLLVGGKDGTIQEFSAPNVDTYNTTKTFQLPLSGLLLNEFKFKTMKTDLLKAEEEAQKAVEEAEKLRQRLEEHDRRRAQGIEDVEADEEKMDDENDGSDSEREEAEQVICKQGNLLRAFYRRETGNFVISMDGWDAGYLYECTFDKVGDKSQGFVDSVKPIKIPQINDVPITSINLSKNGIYLSFGLQSGALRVHNLQLSPLEELNKFWYMNAHDNQYGVVSEISTSFDNQFLLSISEDGSFFIYSFMSEMKLKEIFKQLKANVKTKEIDGTAADDIDDPNHYSIELEKQKAEHDRMLRSAEDEKQRVRRAVSKLRREFRKLKTRNNELPSYLQLTVEEFVIDPEMKLNLEKEEEALVDLLKRQTAWETEKHNVALKKLQRRFKDYVECDRIVLYSFLSNFQVSTFRSFKLTNEFYQLVHANKRRMTFKETEATNTQTRKISIGVRGAPRGGSKGENVKDLSSLATNEPQSPMAVQKVNKKVANVIEKAEQRKQKRLNRQKEWAELYRNKPDENYEDPEDLLAIQHAEDTIGDYKLKTAPNYVVPEKQRVNAEKKRAQLLDLKKMVHDMKKDFNSRFLQLREIKIEIIKEIKELVRELEHVQDRLPEDFHVPIPAVPVMKPEELPERLRESNRESLLEFRQNVLKENEDDRDVANTNQATIYDSHGSKISRVTATTDPRLRSLSIFSTFSSLQQSTNTSDSPDVVTCEADYEQQQEVSRELSAIKDKIEREQIIRWKYRRDELVQEVHEKLVRFDGDLRMLRHEKLHLDVKLKNAELSQVTLFQELILLKDFEKRENALADKVMIKLQEKEEMEDKREECQEQLNVKKEEQEKLQEHEKMLLLSFSNAIGDNNKFEGFLTKVYKKKVRRAKKKQLEEGNSNDESSEEESDDEYDSDEIENSDEEELDDSVCPAGCDLAIFDQICVLRERRIVLEDALTEAKRGCDATKKELDALTKKVKVVDTALKNARADLEAFQREKQQKLNELDVVVTLRLDQIQYVVNNTIPQDLSSCLVFDRCFFDQLQKRIKELEREKVKQKELYRGRRQQHVQMIRDKKVMESKIKELEDKVQQVQMLKFGKLVELEKLETVSVNRVAEELKEKLRDEEARNLRDVSLWNADIDVHQDKMTQLIRENTKRLDTLTILLQENQQLENQLNARQKNLGGEFQDNCKEDIKEHQQLTHLVQLQAQEIDALKKEINLLSRKGGQVVPPKRESIAGSYNLS